MKKNTRGGVREGAGRKATGLVRSKPFYIRLTEEELKFLNESINKQSGKTKTEKFLRLIGLTKIKNVV